MPKYKTIFFSIILIIFIMGFAPMIVSASETPCGKEFCLNVPIGTSLTGFDIKSGAEDILGKYVEAWYGFLLGTIGIMATVMIMWGGFKYLTSRGDKGVIDTAKTQIISAITGVVLAFTSYGILSLINPGLLTIKMPTMSELQGGGNISLRKISLNQMEADINRIRGTEMVLPNERQQLTNTLTQNNVAIQQPNINQTQDDMMDIASFSTNAIASLEALGLTTPDSNITLRTNASEVDYYRENFNAEATFSSDPSFLDYVSQNATAVYRADLDADGNIIYSLLAPGTPTDKEDIFVLPTGSGNIGVSPLRTAWDHWAIIDMKKIIK